MSSAAVSVLDDPLASGHAALARGAWEDARDCFERAIAREETAEALEGLGLAAYWLDDAALTRDARERAYRRYRHDGDRIGAARVALWLAWDANAFRGEPAVASGWVQRARRLLDGLPLAPEHGLVLIREGELALSIAHDPITARQRGAEAAAIARTLGNANLEAIALSLEGLALVNAGRIDDGMRLLDEATAVATAGEVTDLNAIGFACCRLIVGCERVRDFDRASQWCGRLRDLCTRWQLRSLLAVCRVQYASVLTWRGPCQEAET
jgi:hypothetical protein